MDAYAQIIKLGSPHLQSIRREINSETGDELLHYDFKQPLVFDDLALIVGDAIHNFKTATDHGWFILLSAFAPAALNNYSKLPVDTTKQQLEARFEGIKNKYLLSVAL